MEVSDEDRFDYCVPWRQVYCVEVSPEDRFTMVSLEDRLCCVEVSPEDKFDYCVPWRPVLLCRGVPWRFYCLMLDKYQINNDDVIQG